MADLRELALHRKSLTAPILLGFRPEPPVCTNNSSQLVAVSSAFSQNSGKNRPVLLREDRPWHPRTPQRKLEKQAHIDEKIGLPSKSFRQETRSVLMEGPIVVVILTSFIPLRQVVLKPEEFGWPFIPKLAPAKKGRRHDRTTVFGGNDHPGKASTLEGQRLY